MEENKVLKLQSTKIKNDDFEVEFDILVDGPTKSDKAEYKDNRRQQIEKGIYGIDQSLSSNNKMIEELNKEIDRLTYNSDGKDYMIAVGSGVLCGLIDVFWVGEFNFECGNTWSEEKVNNFVVKTAQTQGYIGDDLQGAISYLEGKYHIPSDSNINDLGGSRQHHLRDFAHHPNIIGLFFSMLTQFTEKAYGTDELGVFKIVEVKNKEFIGKDLPHKFLYGTVSWFFHIVSDMAGSKSSPGAGTGLPGPLLALAKELSTLPFFKNLEIGDNSISVWISKLFNGTLLAKRDNDGKIIEPIKFDLRAELGIAYELGRQAIPVIINECIVRGFYFISRFAAELKEKNIKHFKELDRVDWENTLPFKNRTIVRMLTIATGTFTVIDIGAAAIEGGIKSAGNPGLFAKEFILHVNFVGVGRFAVAVSTDAVMGIKRKKLISERIDIYSQQLHLMNAKVYYMQANTWLAAENAAKSINEAFEMMEKAIEIFVEAWDKKKQLMNNIGEYRQGVEEHNSGLIEEIDDILTWG